MKNTLTLCACTIATFSLVFPAQAQETIALQVSQIGDVELSCGALSQEALLMKDIIDTTQDIKDDSKMRSHGINAAAGIGGFLIGTVTGGIGLAAAGFLLDQDTKNDSTQADNVQDIAEQRRSFMVGIFNAKGCQGPLEYALQDKAPVTLVDKMGVRLSAIAPAAGGEEIYGVYPQRSSEKQKPHYNN